MRVALLTTLALLLMPPALAGAATAPDATTGAARDIERTSATLTGTVDPNGSAATYRFEYGTTSTYGLRTDDQPAGAGNGAVAAEASVTDLTGDTTYHYRIVASNAGGTTTGADKTFHTKPDPRPPVVTRPGVRDVTPVSATLRALIDPNDGATTYRFDYGRTTAYGSQTETRDAGDGDTAVAATVPVTGLRPNTRYHFRVVATNAAGTTITGDRSFVTEKQPTAVTLRIVSGTTPWGGGVELSGRVTGIGVGGIPVGLERQDFPFSTPASSTGTPFPVRADSHGRFRFFLSPLFTTTRLRAVTRSRVVVFSTGVEARVAVRVSATAGRLPHNRVRLRGAVHPAAPNGRALLQRRSPSGHWVFVRGAALIPLSGDRSRYSFTVRRGRKPRAFRVKVVARDGGAHFPGHSRAIVVSRR